MFKLQNFKISKFLYVFIILFFLITYPDGMNLVKLGFDFKKIRFQLYKKSIILLYYLSHFKISYITFIKKIKKFYEHLN
jgi:hypothetical protein